MNDDQTERALSTPPAARNLMPAIVVATAVVLTVTSVGILVAAWHLGRTNTAASGARPIPQAAAVQLSAPSYHPYHPNPGTPGVVWLLVNYDHLYRSTDQGIHWVQRPMPTDFGVKPVISFLTDNEGWLLAPGSPAAQCQVADAVLWHTNDAGATWQRWAAEGIGQSQCKADISFDDNKSGYVSAWDPNHRPTVYATSDFGNTWAARTLPDPPDFKSQPGGFTLQVVWVKRLGSGGLYLEAFGSQNDAIHDRRYIFTSTDGLNWKWLTKLPSRSIVMVTDTRWLDLSVPGQSMESTNGGLQFHLYASDFKTDAPGRTQLVFTDAKVGYAAGGGRLQRTLDGGLHWTRLATPRAAASATPERTSMPASPARTASPCTPVASPPPFRDWKSYTNYEHGFTVSYPPGFAVVEDLVANPLPGWLGEFRVVDNCFLGTYPPGQVEMGVYAMDADTLTAWVNKHSVARCMDSGGFFSAVSNERSVKVGPSDAVAFDQDHTGCESGVVVHTTVLLFGTGNVFRLDWWSKDPNYSPTVQAIAEHMLGSV